MDLKQIANFRKQLVRGAKADPRKAGVLGALAVVMVFMWVRLLGGKTGPAPAAAGVSSARLDSALSPSLSKLVAPKAAGAQQQLEEWLKRPISPLSRNVFTVNYDFFPQDGSKLSTLRVPQGDGFWDQLAKSMTARADQKREREVLVENLRLQAAQLKVQSTVMGARPRALMNGELVSEGDVVASFRVTKIEARRVVVEREGIKLEIRLN